MILIGTILTASCFIAFGFCRTLWQAIIVQAIMGLVNGNAGSCLTVYCKITLLKTPTQESFLRSLAK